MNRKSSPHADTETLWAAARQRSFTRLAPTLTHDVRGPLNALGLNVEVIRQLNARDNDRAADLKKQQGYLESIQAQIKRLDGMVQEFMAQAFDPLSAQPTAQDLARLFETQERLVTSLGHLRQLTLRTRFQERPCYVRARRGWLEQVLLDMLLEAMFCLPKGGILEARLEARQEQACFRILGQRGAGAAGENRQHRTPHEVTLGVTRLLAAEVGGKLEWNCDAGDEGQDLDFSLWLPLLGEEQT